VYLCAEENFAFLGEKPKTSLINSGIISLDLTRKPSSPTHSENNVVFSIESKDPETDPFACDKNHLRFVC